MTGSRLVTRRLGLQVEFHHVDMMRVVHNSRYFIWFEKGRLALIGEFLPLSYAIANHLVSPVVENRCEYLAPARFDDQLVLTTRHRLLEKWEGRFVFDHSISHARTKVELCFGHTAVTLLNEKTQSLIREIPQPIWEKYRALR